MPATTPMPTKNPGDVLTSALWNTYLRDNIDKLLTRGHRVLTVAQFGALSSPEGTKGTVAPDEVYLEVDSTNGIQWHLAYESGEPTYRWRYLGGPPLLVEVDTAEGTASTTYADVATVGPSLSAPRAGDYILRYGVHVFNNVAAAQCWASPFLGGAPSDADAVTAVVSNANNLIPGARTRRKTTLTTGMTVKLQYRVASGTGSFERRFLEILPTRIG